MLHLCRNYRWDIFHPNDPIYYRLGISCQNMSCRVWFPANVRHIHTSKHRRSTPMPSITCWMLLGTKLWSRIELTTACESLSIIIRLRPRSYASYFTRYFNKIFTFLNNNSITYCWIHILKIQPLDYMFYMVLTCMPIFLPIRCNSPFDL